MRRALRFSYSFPAPQGRQVVGGGDAEEPRTPPQRAVRARRLDSQQLPPAPSVPEAAGMRSSCSAEGFGKLPADAGSDAGSADASEAAGGARPTCSPEVPPAAGAVVAGTDGEACQIIKGFKSRSAASCALAVFNDKTRWVSRPLASMITLYLIQGSRPACHIQHLSIINASGPHLARSTRASQNLLWGPGARNRACLNRRRCSQAASSQHVIPRARSGFTSAACSWLGRQDNIKHNLHACRSVPACAGSTQTAIAHGPQAAGSKPCCGV